jgi:hypothetical protein
MGTKRTPIGRSSTPQLTPRAIAAFRRMRELEEQCTCEPVDPERYWELRPCAACDAWWREHWILHQEFGCRPWEFPCIREPDVDALPSSNPWARLAEERWQALVSVRKHIESLESVVIQKW